MHKLNLIKSPCVALVALFLMPSAQGEEPETVRHNGGSWIEFGPALMNSTKRIVLYDDDNPSWKQLIEVVETDPEFPYIKHWIKDRIQGSLNFSPTKPGPGAVWPHRVVKLFDAPPRRPKGTPIHQLTLPPDNMSVSTLVGEDDRDDMLLRIPLNTDTLRMDKKSYEKEYQTLKSFFEMAQKRLQNRRPQLNSWLIESQGLTRARSRAPSCLD